MYKSLLFLGMVVFTSVAFSQNAILATETNIVASIPVETNENASSDAFATSIESILSHPAVQKTQLSRHTIQAVGYRNDNQIHFNVQIHKEHLHGRWQSFYSNNQMCDSGSLKKNVPDGEWKTWYPDGQLKTIRHYNADKYHYIKADVQRNHPKYPRYRITQYAQQRKNISRYFQPSYGGQSTLLHTALLEKIRHNTEGDGTSYIPPFANSLHHGLYINYEVNGRVKDSGYYVNGLKHGIWVESTNGKAVQEVGFYNHGHRTGQWKYYDENGRLLYSGFYKRNGSLQAKHTF